jgi:hypothetical protein
VIRTVSRDVLRQVCSILASTSANQPDDSRCKGDANSLAKFLIIPLLRISTIPSLSSAQLPTPLTITIRFDTDVEMSGSRSVD